MPGSYILSAAHEIVYSRAWGVLTDGEVHAHARTLGADPRFRPDFRQVVDFLAVTDLHLTSTGIMELAKQTPFARDSRRGFAVATDEAYGLTRMFELYTDAAPDKLSIFRDLASAMMWAGLDKSAPWPSQPPDKTFDVPPKGPPLS